MHFGICQAGGELPRRIDQFRARPKECWGALLRLRTIQLPFGDLKMYINLWDPEQLSP